MDVMRRLAEAHNTSVHFDRIPNECPTVLTELNLGGIYHLLALPDHGDVEYDETREVIFAIEKIIRYSANLFRMRVARMHNVAAAVKHDEKIDTDLKLSAIRARLPELSAEDKNAEDHCDIMKSPPYGMSRTNDVEDEEIVEVEVDTIDGRHPGYCILNDCIEFSYGLQEVFAACEPGERVTVRGASQSDF